MTEFKLGELKAAATELNKILFEEGSDDAIDVKGEKYKGKKKPEILAQLKTEILEASEILEPGDNPSKETLDIINALRAEKADAEPKKKATPKAEKKATPKAEKKATPKKPSRDHAVCEMIIQEKMVNIEKIIPKAAEWYAKKRDDEKIDENALAQMERCVRGVIRILAIAEVLTLEDDKITLT